MKVSLTTYHCKDKAVFLESFKRLTTTVHPVTGDVMTGCYGVTLLSAVENIVGPEDVYGDKYLDEIEDGTFVKSIDYILEGDALNLIDFQTVLVEALLTGVFPDEV